MNQDIAIVGMSALFPGAGDLASYWHNIVRKADFVTTAPPAWTGPYLDPHTDALERIYTDQVGLLGDLAEFNPLDFGIPPNTVDGSEPDHFLAIKLARDALWDAGYQNRPFDGARTGVILGRGSNPNRGHATGFQYGLALDQTMDILHTLLPDLDTETRVRLRQELQASLPQVRPEAAPGLVSNVATGRIANRLNLMGPNYMIDAACASSLIAVELAIRELLHGSSDMMLAGGCQGSMPPQIYMLFCRIGALSRGAIRPFDRLAGGTLLGEGVGFLVLKRRADAERDGDRIYAMLKGVGTSSDGKALGLLAPRFEGQVLALERVYQQTGLDPKTLTLVEAHGTGIPIGDQTEIQTLKHIFGQREGLLPTVGLGSVKSMIGHCIPASGVASLIKMALSLYHKVLPPTLCTEVNPQLGIEHTPFYINTEVRPWIHGNPEAPRRAGVNAFGFGGINAHAVLEEYTGPQPTWARQVLRQWPTELLLFSGASPQALLALIEQVQQTLQARPVPLSDLAYTLAQRPAARHRLALVVESSADAQSKLEKVAKKLRESSRIPNRAGIFSAQTAEVAGKVAFLFPGEGSQYPGMLADLCLYFPQVRSWFDQSDRSFWGRWAYLPSQILFPPPTTLGTEAQKDLAEQIYWMDVATETVFTCGMALYTLLSEFGIRPDAMVGHSTGEHTALIASGTIQWQSEADLVTMKHNLNQMYKDLDATDRIPRGVLINVGAIPTGFLEALVAHSPDDFYLAMDNCPNQAILFSRPETSEAALAKIKAAGGICTLLPFDRPYHTPWFKDVEMALRGLYAHLEMGPGHTPLYSCATGAAFPSAPDAIRTVAAKQWSCRVRFRETIEALYAEGVRTFIEVGPSSNLSAFVKDILHGREHQILPSNVQRKSSLEQIHNLLARLWVSGMTLDLSPLYRERELCEIALDSQPAPPKPKGTMPVNLLLPKMHLPAAFTQPAQMLVPPALVVPELHVASPIADFIVLEDELFLDDDRDAPAESYSHEVVKDQDPHLTALMGHFDLMQEFLVTQARVADSFYAQPPEKSDDG
ncbi:type I polyketide synthase [Anthocerotibacter panamensis]|uniref:type I polyketide synthase n=1 Tax=Anthocerotibacter panamensis TaxID=2857077 RepID=UPI001C406965|nr:type I polyketide synthase [Anthocerotibacter panamensis]